MKFEAAYEVFMKKHAQQRKGERLRRLNEGHGHAEKLFLEQVWWPAFNHLEHLHPEYEIYDFKDGTRYLDFAYFRSSLRLCLEIDGYGPHLREANRWQFADHLLRQNHLIIDGWIVLRFSYDDIKEKPRRCQQVIQQFMGRWFEEHGDYDDLSCYEKELMRFAVKKHTPFTPAEACSHLGIGRKFVYKLLGNLLKKNFLIPSREGTRVRSYELNKEHVRATPL